MSAGLAFWVVGCLPWVIGVLPWVPGRLRLPPQNLWHSETSPDAMPVVALPFSQYWLAQLLAMTTIGGIVAGLASLLARRQTRHRALAAAVTGGLVGALLATGQTWAVARAGLEPSTDATIYLTALVGVCVAGTLVGLVSGAVLVAGPPVLRASAAAVASVAVGPWLGALILRDPGGLAERGAWLVQHVHWVAGLVLGVGLALTGLQPLRRLVGWVAALLVAWLGPAALVAVGAVGGSARSQWSGDPVEQLGIGRDLFVTALAPSTRPLGGFVLALFVGLLGSLWAIQARRSDAVRWSP